MQSRFESAVEAWMNVLSGFGISWLMWMFVVAPLYGYENGPGTSFSITCIFTVSSLLRSYAIRRWFNYGWKRAVHKVATTLAPSLGRSTASGEGNQDTQAKRSKASGWYR